MYRSERVRFRVCVGGIRTAERDQREGGASGEQSGPLGLLNPLDQRLEKLARDPERHLTLELSPPSRADRDAVVAHELASLAQKPRLTDPRRPLDQHHRSLPGGEALQRAGKDPQLALALEQGHPVSFLRNRFHPPFGVITTWKRVG